MAATGTKHRGTTGNGSADGNVNASGDFSRVLPVEFAEGQGKRQHASGGGSRGEGGTVVAAAPAEPAAPAAAAAAAVPAVAVGAA